MTKISWEKIDNNIKDLGESGPKEIIFEVHKCIGYTSKTSEAEEPFTKEIEFFEEQCKKFQEKYPTRAFSYVIYTHPNPNNTNAVKLWEESNKDNIKRLQTKYLNVEELRKENDWKVAHKQFSSKLRDSFLNNALNKLRINNKYSKSIIDDIIFEASKFAKRAALQNVSKDNKVERKRIADLIEEEVKLLAKDAFNLDYPENKEQIQIELLKGKEDPVIHVFNEIVDCLSALIPAIDNQIYTERFKIVVSLDGFYDIVQMLFSNPSGLGYITDSALLADLDINKKNKKQEKKNQKSLQPVVKNELIENEIIFNQDQSASNGEQKMPSPAQTRKTSIGGKEDNHVKKTTQEFIPKGYNTRDINLALQSSSVVKDIGAPIMLQILDLPDAEADEKAKKLGRLLREMKKGYEEKETNAENSYEEGYGNQAGMFARNKFSNTASKQEQLPQERSHQGIIALN